MTVKIPGGVECYVVDLRGERHPLENPELWNETCVSCILRCLLDRNDEPLENDQKPLMGLRKMDPMPTLAAEKRFLDACKYQFWKGWQLGGNALIQIPSYTSNHLVDALVKYFTEANRLKEATEFFKSLYEEDHEVCPVYAHVLLKVDEEIAAVEAMYEAAKKPPINYELLIVQSKFMISKKQYEKALKLAKLAVVHAPSEFRVWAHLAEIYIELEDFESALLSINSCPMFTFHDRDAHTMPPPARTHLPLRPDVSNIKESEIKTVPVSSGGLEDENDPSENQVHPELQRLPSLSLRGTFSAAYGLLVQICNKVGWDELLKYRSKVFVMEDEYRIHRAIVEEAEKFGDEEPVEKMEAISLDDEEERPKSSGKAKLAIDDIVSKAIQETPSPSSAKSKRTPNPRLAQHRISFSFKHKRLCEKWLDNLFMVLYNDLRLYTALKQVSFINQGNGPI